MPDEPAPANASVNAPMNAPVILVIDDDEGVRDIVAESLELLGHAVMRAPDGNTALALLDTNPQIGLIVTDVRMAGLSGLEVADMAKARRPELRIILISGYFQPQALRIRFLKKPFSMDELDGAVQAELDALSTA